MLPTAEQLYQVYFNCPIDNKNHENYKKESIERFERVREFIIACYEVEEMCPKSTQDMFKKYTFQYFGVEEEKEEKKVVEVVEDDELNEFYDEQEKTTD